MKQSRILAISLGVLSLVMFAGGILSAVLAAIAEGKIFAESGGMVTFIAFLAFPVVGTVVAAKRPENSIGWVCLAAGLFWMFIGFMESFIAYWSAAYGESYFSTVYYSLGQGLWVAPVGLLGVYMILLFPDGRLPSPKWRPLAYFSGALMALLTVAFAVLPGPLVGNPEVRNPFGFESLAGAAEFAIFVVLLFPVCILLSAASVVVRFRRASGEVREQIKWLAFAACFVGITYFGGLLGQLVFVPESFDVNVSEEPLWVSLINTLTTISYAGVPIAVGVAVLKYRLYDIEVIVNRALVYGSLTLLLGATYFGSVVSLQYVFRGIAGNDSQLAIVASTLAIAALFVPLRRRLQRFVDRRFYRQKYDGRLVLEAFSRRLRDETEIEVLSGDLIGVVHETVRPTHSSLWLRETSEKKR